MHLFIIPTAKKLMKNSQPVNTPKYIAWWIKKALYLHQKMLHGGLSANKIINWTTEKINQLAWPKI